ncbi:tRNA-2-methylthio-N(6)-dimethylallyladenosine synthase [Rickettsia tillamookensis]|uniref:tRNA-2-methylthio-N(6)-dimethylallyladenosine synthase n=2 Tax=Rickettsia tillamookensis TaxID=2761623 RepID=A0A9E6SR39_9RICK|nr:tRNA-2-methylthio-N(6)-dimethylallyladenosine synthase [Rickettsia tillamookensis]
MNVYDSVKMQDLLYPFGYEPTENIEDADVIILNTCHIREKAAEKTYSELGRIKKLQDTRKKQGLSSAIIVVAGCVAQAEGEEIFSRTPYVDIVVGPQSYYNLPELISKVVRHEKHLIDLDFVEEAKFDNLPEQLYPQGASSFISVQEGCDKFCTFCVVPYTRGAEFSRNVEQVYREALKVVSSGAKEIMLLGQNVNAYHGKGLDDKIFSLADLLKHLAQIPNLERLRYMTSHPIDMNDDLIKLHGTEPKLMPFLHLPVQSGSNKILKAMNRKHDRDYYFDIINRLREARPDIVLSSDFIVGFPGETDEDFENTLDLVRRVKYGQCYSFKYSPRPGTPGATRTDQVPEHIKSERLTILQKELMAQQLAFNESCVGSTMKVLFDRSGKFDDQIIGKTPYMQSVYIQNPNKSLLGKIIDVKITKASLNSLTGEIV